MFKTLAIVAALTAGASSVAMAQNYVYSCPLRYALINGMCQPVATPGGVRRRCRPARPARSPAAR